MGQGWMVINVDNRQCSGPDRSRYSPSLGEFFWKESTLAALLFRRPQKLAMPKTEMAVDTSCLDGPASLLRLPLELLTAIANLLGDGGIRDVLSFALASQSCWYAAASCLQAYIDGEPTTWAGHSIMCVGSYASGWPEGVLTEAEELEEESKCEHEDSEEGTDFGPYAWAQYELCSSKLRERVLEHFSDFRPKRCSTAEYRMADGYLRQVYYDVRKCPVPKQTVLRNLDKKVYVRQSALDALNAAIAAEDDVPKPSVSFNQVLLTRLCWTDDPSSGMSCWVPDDMFPGPWAGDCIDIVLKSNFKKRTRKGWTDESDKIVDMMRQMVKTEDDPAAVSDQQPEEWLGGYRYDLRGLIPL